MSPQDRRTLAGAPVFHEVAPADVAAILDRAEVLSQARRQPLFQQGDPPRGLWLVVAGRYGLTARGGDQREVAVRFLAAGDLVAPADPAQPQPVPLPVTAVAQTDGRTAFWPFAVLAELSAAVPRWAENVARESAERAHEVETRLGEASKQRTEQRLAHLLLRLARQAGQREPDGVRIDFPLTRQDLAEMTGSTLFVVSRLLSDWAGRGLIEVGRGRVVVRSPSGLVTLAEGTGE